MTTKPKKGNQQKKRFYDAAIAEQIEHLAGVAGVLEFHDHGRTITADVNASEVEIVLADCDSLLRPQLVAELRRVAEFYSILADVIEEADPCETERKEIKRQEACDKAMRELENTATTKRFCNPN